METGEGIPGTGLPSLDRVIQGVIPGDNIGWRTDLIGDYAVLVESFRDNALRNGRKLVYFRFARHPALLPADCCAEIHVLSPEVGFETFTAQIHKVIGNSRRGTYYVFDCLSDLAADWYSDMRQGAHLPPAAESSVLAGVLDGITPLRVDSASRTLDIWDRKFLQAQEAQENIKRGSKPTGGGQEPYRARLRIAGAR